MHLHHKPGIGTVIGGYTIIRELGHGSMARVWLAEDPMGHRVALKTLGGESLSPTLLERFRREVEANKMLRRHPYILTVYATGKDGSYHYIAMEYIEGSKNLNQQLMDSGYHRDKILELFSKILGAVGYAHDLGIVHRDIKPDNIMVDEFGEPLLADFGVAEMEDQPGLTAVGSLAGTPNYMSPEQASRQRVDNRSDLYSIGVMLYEALCGSLPYALSDAPSTEEVLTAVRAQSPIRPRKRNSKISRELEFVILKSLAKDPRERYQNARDFADDLERLLRGDSPAGRFIAPGLQLWHYIKRNKVVVGLITLLIMLTACGVWIYSRSIQQIRYERLVSEAQLANAKFEMRNQLQQGPGNYDPDRALEFANRAFLRKKWKESQQYARYSIALNQALQQIDAANEATLLLAQTFIMTDQFDEALTLYRDLLTQETASPATLANALIEGLMLTTYLSQQNIKTEPLPIDESLLIQHPLSSSIQALLKNTEHQQSIAIISTLPYRMQNDAWFCAYLATTNNAYLLKAINTSVPSSEWPGAWAIQIYRKNMP